MSTAHFILQGKGGVGKSVIASLLYQYFEYKGVDVLAIDTDPENHSLAGYKSFNVELHDILLDGKTIDQQKWDALIDKICDDVPENAHVIVDNGASSFLALKDYILDNDVVGTLKDEGVTPYFHAVITGGAALHDTLEGFNKLCGVLPPDTKFIVWLNPFFGKIEWNGKSFLDFKYYKDNESRISEIIQLPEVDAQTLGRDLSTLFIGRKSLNDAITSDQTHRMTRGRLKRYRDKLFSFIDRVGFEIVSAEPAPAAAAPVVPAEAETPAEESDLHYDGPFPDENQAAETGTHEEAETDDAKGEE